MFVQPPETLATLVVTTKSDIWSFGLLLYEMFVGRDPLPPEDAESLSSLARAGKLVPRAMPGSAPAEIRAMFELCCHQDPSRRPTAKQLLDVVNKWAA